MPQYTFSKKQRLKSRRQLQAVFTGGNAFVSGAVRLLAVKEAGSGTVRCGVGANKRTFKRAVDRNRVKRLLRECYRLQQAPLAATAAHRCIDLSLFILYRGRELPAYAPLYEQVGAALQKLNLAINEPDA